MLFYEWFKHMNVVRITFLKGKDAAIKEMYKNYEVSELLYRKALLLLHHLSDARSSDVHDKEVLSQRKSWPTLRSKYLVPKL